MEEIFKQYGTPIIIAIVVVALIAIIGVLVSVDGPVSTAFNSMLDGLVTQSGVTD